MKKFLLSLTLMLATVAAWAEDGFYVVTTSGEQAGFIFSEQPVWTYEGDNLVITCMNNTVEYPMADVDCIYFDEIGSSSPTGIAEFATCIKLLLRKKQSEKFLKIRSLLIPPLRNLECLVITEHSRINTSVPIHDTVLPSKNYEPLEGKT